MDAVFHLASIPGGAAEKNHALGRSINLDAILGLLEDLRGVRAADGGLPRFVFASTVPVAAQGVAWWISVGACVDNLLHAACVDPARLAPQRSYQMPVLRLAMDEVVQGLARRFGADRPGLVRYAPDPQVERLFAAYPPLRTPEAEALGLRHDGDLDTPDHPRDGWLRRATPAGSAAGSGGPGLPAG